MGLAETIHPRATLSFRRLYSLVLGHLKLEKRQGEGTLGVYKMYFPIDQTID